MPDSFAVTPDGLLLVANGVDEVLVWDGLGDAQPAGLLPPATALTLAGSLTGTITGDYSAYVRYLDASGNVSNLSPIAGPVTLTDKGRVDYTAVPVPVQPKVVRRQILRNTAGQTAVYYVDIDTTDLTSPGFHSTKTDTQLQARTAVPLFSSAGVALANGHGSPPTSKSILCHHLDRMFLAGEIEYREGSVAVTTGSTTVTGAGTEWPTTFAGRFLWVDGALRPVEIASVDREAQTLTLVSSYPGHTNPYAPYAIRPAAGDRRTIYYSVAGEPQSWPATQALSLQEDGDTITGLMAKGSFLYILEEHHIYRFTFQADPATDGYVFLSGSRGACNNRSWVVVDEQAYMMDEAGIHAFGSGESEAISGPVQDLFEPERQGSLYKVQWPAKRYFHAAYLPGQNVIRWFVTLAGTGFPRHALCLELSQRRWWIEEYPVPIAASCLARFRSQPRLFLGGPGGEVYLFGEGQSDRARPGPTLRGTVGSASPLVLTDPAALFDESLVGCPVTIVSGRGRGQRRLVADQTATTLVLDHPWLIRPDDTSVYQVGGISYRWRSKMWRYDDGDQETPRRLEVLFEPHEDPGSLSVRFFHDRASDPVLWGSTGTLNGFSCVEGDAFLEGDLARPAGYLQRRVDSFKDLYADGPRFVELELSGVTNGEPVAVYQLSLDGVG